MKLRIKYRTDYFSTVESLHDKIFTNEAGTDFAIRYEGGDLFFNVLRENNSIRGRYIKFVNADSVLRRVQSGRYKFVKNVEDDKSKT